jgi:hypothetical protein
VGTHHRRKTCSSPSRFGHNTTALSRTSTRKHVAWPSSDRLQRPTSSTLILTRNNRGYQWPMTRGHSTQASIIQR